MSLSHRSNRAIARVPSEIWSIIFEGVSGLIARIPVELMLVCCQWRDAVEGTPGCFSRLYFSSEVDNARQHLEKAGVGSVDLKVDLPEEFDGVQQFLKNNRHLISSYASRLHSLSVSASSEDLIEIFLRSVFHTNIRIADLHQLTSLALRIQREADPRANNLPAMIRSLIDQLPQLTSIEMPVNFSTLNARWRQPVVPLKCVFLRRFDIWPYSWCDVFPTLSLLQQAPNVEELFYVNTGYLMGQNSVFSNGHPKAYCFEDPAGGEPIPRPLLTPSLKHLTIYAYPTGPTLLRCIHAPLLECLVIDGRQVDEPDSDWVHQNSYMLESLLVELWERSPNLRKLELKSAFLFHRTWKWLLNGGTIEKQQEPEDQFNGFIPHDPSPPFPNLEELVIDQNHFAIRFKNTVDDDPGFNRMDLRILDAFRNAHLPNLRKLYLRSIDMMNPASFVAFAGQRSVQSPLDVIVEDCPVLSRFMKGTRWTGDGVSFTIRASRTVTETDKMVRRRLYQSFLSRRSYKAKSECVPGIAAHS